MRMMKKAIFFCIVLIMLFLLNGCEDEIKFVNINVSKVNITYVEHYWENEGKNQDACKSEISVFLKDKLIIKYNISNLDEKHFGMSKGGYDYIQCNSWLDNKLFSTPIKHQTEYPTGVFHVYLTAKFSENHNNYICCWINSHTNYDERIFYNETSKICTNLNIPKLC